MLVIAGALTGFLIGLVGVGGGALMTPILLLVFGTAPTSAIGTDLWFAAITKIFATKINTQRQLIDWQIVKRLWLGSLSSTFITILWLKFHPFKIEYIHILNYAIATAVSITAIGMMLQSPLHNLGRKLRIYDASHFKTLQTPLICPRFDGHLST